MCRNFHDIPRCENIPFHCTVEHLRLFKIIDIYITEQFTDRDTESFARAVKKSVYSFIRKLYAIPRKSNTKRFSSFFFFFSSEREINRRDLRNSSREAEMLPSAGKWPIFACKEGKVVARRYRRRSRRLREGSTIHDIVGLRVIATSKDPARSV